MNVLYLELLTYKTTINRFDGCLTIRKHCLYLWRRVNCNERKLLYVYCVMQIFEKNLISKALNFVLNVGNFILLIFFFFKSNWIGFVDINAMKVYLLCGFHFSNDTLICLACHKYIQNQQNKTQSKSIHFIWSQKKIK